MFIILEENSNPYTLLFLLFKKLKNVVRLLKNTWKKQKKNSDLYEQREHEFIHGLNNLFDIVHVNAMTTIKINENKKILTLQRQHGCPGYMLGLDLKLDPLEKRKETRV